MNTLKSHRENVPLLWGRGQDSRCSSLFSYSLTNTMTKSKSGQKGFKWLTGYNHRQGKSKGRNSRPVPGGRGLSRHHGRKEDHHLLACSPLLVQPAFLNQDHVPRDGNPFPTATVKQEYGPQTCLQANLEGISFLFEAFSFQMTISGVKRIKQQPTQL